MFGLRQLLISSALVIEMTLALSTSSTSLERKFQFVPYGSGAPEGIATSIACDGRVPGATLEVTHWNGNETPEELYADTSTGMAMKLAKLNQQQKPNQYDDFDDATVLNNHYDTDGVLSSWTCMKPSQALEYEELFIQGAEAGDFGEWSSDNGVKLDCALCALLEDDEEDSYHKAFDLLPELAHDIVYNGGSNFENLWKPGFDFALQGWKDLESGRANLRRSTSSDIVILEESSSGAGISPYALHRGLVERKLWEGTTRILRVQKTSDDSTLFRYNYERIGHGWVHNLIDRFQVPGADGEILASEMNKHFPAASNCWKSGGMSGLVALCCTHGEGIGMHPDDVANLLAEFDIKARE